MDKLTVLEDLEQRYAAALIEIDEALLLLVEYEQANQELAEDNARLTLQTARCAEVNVGLMAEVERLQKYEELYNGLAAQHRMQHIEETAKLVEEKAVRLGDYTPRRKRR